MTMDRTEVEAVEAICRAWWPTWPDAPNPEGERQRAREALDAMRQRFIAALDAVRRSRQEPSYEAAMAEWDRNAAGWARCREELAAVRRSPQGEDHEAPMGGRSFESGRTFLEERQGEDHEAGIEAATIAAADVASLAPILARRVASAAIAAYLSRCPSPGPIPCMWCSGQGVITGQGYIAECDKCDGSGKTPPPSPERDTERLVEAARAALAAPVPFEARRILREALAEFSDVSNTGKGE